jgi:prolipoprotein diacylglyceryltransferase
MNFSFIIWNASPEIFSYGQLALRWYGLLFALGFLVSQQILYYMHKKEGKPEKEVDTLTIIMVIATILGARLGHVIFYQPEILWENPLGVGLWLTSAVALFSLFSGADVLPESVADAQLPVLALQGIVLYYAGTMLWYEAISRLDLARATAIVVPSVPLLTLVTSFAIVGEVPSAHQLIGLGMIAVGVFSFVRAPHAVERRERIPTATAPLGAPAGDEAGGDAA